MGYFIFHRLYRFSQINFSAPSASLLSLREKKLTIDYTPARVMQMGICTDKFYNYMRAILFPIKFTKKHKKTSANLREIYLAAKKRKKSALILVICGGLF